MAEIITYDKIPALYDILPDGGWPGCKYLICGTAQQATAQAEDWSAVSDVFYIEGPKGKEPALLMRKGNKIPGSARRSAVSPLSLDVQLEEKTGLKAVAPISERLKPEGLHAQPEESSQTANAAR